MRDVGAGQACRPGEEVTQRTERGPRSAGGRVLRRSAGRPSPPAFYGSGAHLSALSKVTLRARTMWSSVHLPSNTEDISVASRFG